MIQLIYRSVLTPKLNLPEVYEIMKEARKNNPVLKITGVLLFNTQFFLQLIEGPEESINSLYPVIERDRRHQKVELISSKAIVERTWANWSMALVMPTAENKPILSRYSKSGTFSPFDLTADTATMLLTDLAKQGVVDAAF
jgi:Sensors of blue-light using FAD